MKALYAGPWVGEFGHEIMIWQAYLRGIADRYEHITVCGPPGHFGMYGDFAQKYINFKCDTTYANMWMNDEVEKKVIEYFHDAVGENENALNADWITPRSVWEQYVGFNKAKLITAIQPRAFIPFGNTDDYTKYDILYHARHRTDWDSDFRNWTEEQCKELLNKFPNKRIGCVGLSHSALHIEGTEDLRNISLKELTNIMATSRCFVGPISGPTHLATLCGLPQATWATKQEHANRVQNTWNPFKTKVNVITADDSVWKNRTAWTPPTEDIEQNIRSLLNEQVAVSV